MKTPSLAQDYINEENKEFDLPNIIPFLNENFNESVNRQLQ
jgi:hypothetical protein